MAEHKEICARMRAAEKLFQFIIQHKTPTLLTYVA